MWSGRSVDGTATRLDPCAFGVVRRGQSGEVASPPLADTPGVRVVRPADQKRAVGRKDARLRLSVRLWTTQTNRWMALSLGALDCVEPLVSERETSDPLDPVGMTDDPGLPRERL